MIAVATQRHLLRRWCAGIFASKGLACVRGFLVCSGSKQVFSSHSAGIDGPFDFPQFLLRDVKLHFLAKIQMTKINGNPVEMSQNGT